MQRADTKKITSALQAASRPDAVLPLGLVEEWIDRPHLLEDPFPDKIGASHPEKTDWFKERVTSSVKEVRRRIRRIEEAREDASTKAQWRDEVRLPLSHLKQALHRWQVWHALHRLSTHGWLARPIWHLRTKRQGEALGKLLQQDKALDEMEFDKNETASYHDGPGRRTFKTMEVQSQTEWDELAKQVQQLGLLRVVVDAGPVPESSTGVKGEKKLWLYQYRTLRIDKEGSPTKLQGVSAQQRSEATEIGDLPPFSNEDPMATENLTGSDREPAGNTLF